MLRKLLTLVLATVAACGCNCGYDVIVAGGGASGVCAGIQSQRCGAKTLIIEEGPWLGGMLTSAGVSAIDGNYRLRAGLFGEFCDSLAARYGGYDSLCTGWVSSILFEPRTGAEVLDNMCAGVPVLRNTVIDGVRKLRRGWELSAGGRKYRCKVLIDCTELGDVARMCGVTYEKGNGDGIIQDLTYVLTVQDFGPDADKTIPEPAGYDRNLYVNCCVNPLNTETFEKGQTLWSRDMMMSYGLLPGGKVMLNWPIEGNDYYADIIDATPEEREAAYRAAKDKSLGYLYFIQTELGLRNWGIAEGEYPTEDGLPLIPYHRESRRICGEARFTIDAAADPYGYAEPLYRTGVAVGDYPVDHHHFAHPEWRRLHKSCTQIRSFTVPAGAMIPKAVEDLLVAEKSICTDSIVNGATRLQPVVMELGQAAGVIASLAVRGRCRVRDVSVREVQATLLDAGARIQPYLDLEPSDPAFKALQRVGSTGAFESEGRCRDWRGESWMNIGVPGRIDSILAADDADAFAAEQISWLGE